MSKRKDFYTEEHKGYTKGNLILLIHELQFYITRDINLTDKHKKIRFDIIDKTVETLLNDINNH